MYFLAEFVVKINNNKNHHLDVPFISPPLFNRIKINTKAKLNFIHLFLQTLTFTSHNNAFLFLSTKMLRDISLLFLSCYCEDSSFYHITAKNFFSLPLWLLWGFFFTVFRIPNFILDFCRIRNRETLSLSCCQYVIKMTNQ